MLPILTYTESSAFDAIVYLMIFRYRIFEIRCLEHDFIRRTRLP